MGWGFAGCPRCRVPLISTMAFSHAEFYCLDCGGAFGFLDPAKIGDTPEIEADHAARQAEWDEHVGGALLISASRRSDCALCDGRDGYDHPSHATDEEIAADAAAREWLAARVSIR